MPASKRSRLMAALTACLILPACLLGLSGCVSEELDVELVQLSRSADGTELVGYDSSDARGKVLVPVVSLDDCDDAFGLPVQNGYVDMIASARNVGLSDAYVRLTVAVPSSLRGALVVDAGRRLASASASWDGDWAALDVVEGASVNVAGEDPAYVEYDLYTYVYNGVLGAGEGTSPAVAGVYLDRGFDSSSSDALSILVKVEAAQAIEGSGDGSDPTAAERLNALLYEITAQNHPWSHESASGGAAQEPSPGEPSVTSDQLAGGLIGRDADVDEASVRALLVAAGSEVMVENGVLKIYGGTWSADPSGYVADGYAVTQNANGTYTVLPE